MCYGTSTSSRVYICRQMSEMKVSDIFSIVHCTGSIADNPFFAKFLIKSEYITKDFFQKTRRETINTDAEQTYKFPCFFSQYKRIFSPTFQQKKEIRRTIVNHYLRLY